MQNVNIKIKQMQNFKREKSLISSTNLRSQFPWKNIKVNIFKIFQMRQLDFLISNKDLPLTFSTKIGKKIPKFLLLFQPDQVSVL